MTISEAMGAAISKLTGDSKSEVVEEKKTEQDTEDSSDDKKSAEEDEEVDDDSDESEDSEEKKEKGKKAKKADEDEEDDPQMIQRAKDLYKALNDPNTSKATLQSLITYAQNRGIELGETKKEQQAAAKSLSEELKDLVPESEHYMLESLGPVFEYVIKKVQSDSDIKVSTLEQKLKEARQEAEIEKYQGKLEKILSREKYEAYLPTMAEIMKKFSPSEGTETEDYIEEIYQLAKAKKGKLTIVKKQMEKAKRNLEEEIPNSSSSKGTSDDTVVFSRNPTMAEAIEAATKGKKIKVG